MPEITGLELLERIHKKPEFRDMSTIVITGRSDAEAIKKALSNGASDFIAKPFTPSALKTRIVRHLIRLDEGEIRGLLGSFGQLWENAK